MHPWSCKVIGWLFSWGSMSSAFTVMALSAERLLIVWFPLKAPHWITRRRVLYFIAAYSSLLFASNSHNIWTTTKATESDLFGCGSNDNYLHFLAKWVVVDSFLNSYIPLALLVIMNTLIIICLHRAGKTKRQLSRGETRKPNRVKVNGSAVAPRGTKRSGDASKQVTSMLISISVFFVVCMVPFTWFQIYLVRYFEDDPRADSSHFVGKIYIIAAFMDFLWQANHACNVFLYCLTGKKFREQLMAVLCCRTAASDVSSSYALHSRTNGVAISQTKISVVTQM